MGYADSVLRHYTRLGGGGGSAGIAAGTPAATGSAATGGTAAAAGSGPSPQAGTPDLGELMGALQALAGQLGGGACGVPLQLPQYRPLPAIDQHGVADAAPSAAGDPDDPAAPSGAAASA